MESSRTGLHEENYNMHKIVVVTLHFVFCNLMLLNSSISHPEEFMYGFSYKMLWNIYLKKMGLIKYRKVHKYVIRDAASWIIFKPQLCAFNFISYMNFSIPIVSCAVSYMFTYLFWKNDYILNAYVCHKISPKIQ